MAVNRKPLRKAVLDELDQLPNGLRDGALATAAVALAELLPDSSPRDAVALARELRQTMAELRAAAVATPEEEVDPVDELARRRARRRASSSPERAGGSVGG